MGKGAEFNSPWKARYHFPAGIQPTGDILLFGGTDIGADEYGIYTHTWTTEDIPRIRSVLDSISSTLKLENPTDYAKYDMSAVGHTQLMKDLQMMVDAGAKEQKRLAHQYMLGSCIAHQVMSLSPLSVTYEG